MELLEFKHLSEQDQFKLLVEMSADNKMQQEVMMMSQQQRKDQLSRLLSKRESIAKGIFMVYEDYEDMKILKVLAEYQLSQPLKNLISTIKSYMYISFT